MVAVAPIIPKRKIPQIFMFSSLLSSYGLFGDGLALSLFRLFPSSPLISSKFRQTNSAISSQLVIEFEIPNTWFRVYPFLSWIGFFFFFFFFSTAFEFVFLGVSWVLWWSFLGREKNSGVKLELNLRSARPFDIFV